MLQGLSLKVKFISFIAGIILVLSLIYSIGYQRRSQVMFMDELRARGERIAATLADKALFGLTPQGDWLGDFPALRSEVEHDEDTAYLLVTDKAGHVLQKWYRSDDLEKGEKMVLDLVPGDDPERMAALRIPGAGEILDFTVRIGRMETTQRTQEALNQEEQLLGLAPAAPVPQTPVPVPAQSFLVRGYVRLGMSPAHVESTLRGLSWFSVLVVLGSLLVGGLLAFFFTERIVGPMGDMARRAVRISEGDLTQRVEIPNRDEVGVLAEVFNRMSSGLNAHLRQVKDAADQVTLLSQGFGTVSTQVIEASQRQAQAVEGSTGGLGRITTAIKGIVDNLGVLHRSAQESSSFALEMGASLDEVSENMGSLQGSVEESAASVTEMAASVRQVAENVKHLFRAAEVTASSMAEMDATIKAVESNATSTAKISEEMKTDSDAGVEAVGRTIRGIQDIQEIGGEIGRVISSLGERAESIGKILAVIDGVAEQTNLLALNAAIIAAQEGEHGKGFAVVADQIRSLAERVSMSSKEIAQLIRAVQTESQHAVTTVGEALQRVEEGVRLAGRAGEALKKISQSSDRSLAMSRQIAQASVEQARGSREITAAFERIALMVQEISRATEEQTKGSEQIRRAAEHMRDIAHHVRNAMGEQVKGTKQIIQTVESINEMVGQINRATQEQSLSSEEAAKELERIAALTRQNLDRLADMGGSVETLSQQARILENVVRQFRV